MRVFYTTGQIDEFPTAEMWNINDDWIELLDSQENILVILNWTHVLKIEIVPWLN